MVLVNMYLICLGCYLQMFELKEVVKLIMMQKLKRMFLVVVFLLQVMFFKCIYQLLDQFLRNDLNRRGYFVFVYVIFCLIIEIVVFKLCFLIIDLF